MLGERLRPDGSAHQGAPEETIRDLKSHRFGCALCYARTKRPERLEAWLLVAAPATFILWLLRHHRESPSSPSARCDQRLDGIDIDRGAGEVEIMQTL